MLGFIAGLFVTIYALPAALLVIAGERLIRALRWPLDLWAMRNIPDEKDDL